MKRLFLKSSFYWLLLPVLLSSCGLFGIHFQVHNPRKAGKYPRFSAETILLGELTDIRKAFDVTFYDLDITIDPKTKTLSGWVGIRATAQQKLDSIQIDLDEPLHIDALKLSSRTGQELTYTRNYRAVYVHFPKAIPQGKTFEIYVQYHGKPVVARKPPWSGGLTWKKDDNKKPWIGVSCETEGTSVWFPCKDHTSDEPDSARMCFSIADTNLLIVSNGKLLGTSVQNGSKYFDWKVSNTINLYNITFYVGDFARVDDSYTGISGKTLPITHYVLKANAAKAAKHFQQVKNHIRIYEELYGDYSWYSDGFKLVESPYAGMEHQSAIAYGNGYKNDLNNREDYIILHETGHEWFGNAITAADLADVWLQEGFTTYGEALYLEKKYGSDVALQHLFQYRFMIKNKLPLVGPVGRRYFDYHDGDVYVKGAWVLHTLRNQIQNDSLFFGAIRTFYAEQKLKTTDSKAFVEVVNRVTGKNYDWFFRQYLYHNTVPFLEYKLYEDGSFLYRWTALGTTDFNQLQINVKINGKNYVLTPSAEIQTLKVPVQKETSVRPDNSKTLFGQRENKKLLRILRREKTAVR
jgi:aminopeptidase N